MRKKFLLALTLMLITLTSWGQTLNIGGHRAVYDEGNTMWLVSIPQTFFGNDYAAIINYGDSISDFAIDSINVASGEEYVFGDIEGSKKYIVTATLNDSTITGYITFTWLPVVEFYGNFTNYYRYGSAIVNEPETTDAEPMFAKIQWNESAGTSGSTKHNFTIKFLNSEDSTQQDRSFFGLRNDSTWILDAGREDFLRVRNRVNTDLWLDMARSAWYADTLTDARKGSRGKLIELVVNGSYMGIYNMCEPLDRKQLGIVPYDKDRKRHHGGIWDSYDWTRTVTMSDPEPTHPGGMRAWAGFKADYPEARESATVLWKPLEDAVRFAPRADVNMKLRIDSMGYYFDLPVMQDYYIFITSLQIIDNESKNIYYACYDTDVNNRLTMFPSATRISLGAPVSPWNSIDNTVLGPERPVNWISHLPMVDMWGVPTYRNAVCDRYSELRETFLNTDNLVNRYRSVVDDLMNSGAGGREQNRWSKTRDVGNKVIDIVKEMDYIEDWIRQRMEFLDKHFVPVPIIQFQREDVNRDGEVNIADINALLDLILTGTIIYNEDGYITGDANADNEVSVADINAVIEYILSI